MGTVAAPSRVVITGPGVTAIVCGSLVLHDEVTAGRWGAVVDVTEGRWLDPDATRAVLDHRGADFVVDRDDCQQVTADTDGDDRIVVHGPVATLFAAVDMCLRVQLGQLSELCFDLRQMDTLQRLRVEHARRDAWPDHPNASCGINSKEVPERVRFAYEALCMNSWRC